MVSFVPVAQCSRRDPGYANRWRSWLSFWDTKPKRLVGITTICPWMTIKLGDHLRFWNWQVEASKISRMSSRKGKERLVSEILQQCWDSDSSSSNSNKLARSCIRKSQDLKFFQARTESRAALLGYESPIMYMSLRSGFIALANRTWRGGDFDSWQSGRYHAELVHSYPCMSCMYHSRELYIASATFEIRCHWGKHV